MIEQAEVLEDVLRALVRLYGVPADDGLMRGAAFALLDITPSLVEMLETRAKGSITMYFDDGRLLSYVPAQSVAASKLPRRQKTFGETYPGRITQK